MWNFESCRCQISKSQKRQELTNRSDNTFIVIIGHLHLYNSRTGLAFSNHGVASFYFWCFCCFFCDVQKRCWISECDLDLDGISYHFSSVKTNLVGHRDGFFTWIPQTGACLDSGFWISGLRRKILQFGCGIRILNLGCLRCVFVVWIWKLRFRIWEFAFRILIFNYDFLIWNFGVWMFC